MTISNIISNYTTFLSWKIEFHYIFRYFFIFIILLFFYNEKFFSKKTLTIFILAALSLQAFDGLFQAFSGYDFIKQNNGNLLRGLTGATFNRNTFGFFMAIGSSISLIILIKYKFLNLTKIEILTIFILFSIFIFNLSYSYSRASWLFFVIFSTVYIYKNHKLLTRYHYIFIILTVLFILVIFFFNDTLLSRFYSLIEGNDSQRRKIWLDAINKIKENFLFGYGLMTYRYIGLKGVSGVHNSIIEILLFLGIVGFIIFTNFLWQILKHILYINSIEYLALFFAFLTITQFDQSIIKGIVSLSPLAIFAFYIFSKDK